MEEEGATLPCSWVRKVRVNDGVRKSPFANKTVIIVSDKSCLWMLKLVEK